MKTPLALLTFLLAWMVAVPQAWAEDCDRCSSKRLCGPHATAEKEALEAAKDRLASKSPRERQLALTELAQLTEAHANAPSAKLAKVLAKSLDDSNLRVRQTAAELLAEGQHRETAVKGLGRLLLGIKKAVASGDMAEALCPEDKSTKAQDEARSYARRVVELAAWAPDDRVAKALLEVMETIPAEFHGDALSSLGCKSLLELGSRDCIAGVIGQLKPWRDVSSLRSIHRQLESLAEDLELDDAPAWGKGVDAQWARWHKKNARRLPAKLGKWSQAD